MVYDDAEKLYAEVRSDTEALIDKALGVLYPDSLPLSSASSTSAGPLTIFAHNTTPFARREIVRVPLAAGGISLGDVLQTTSDGKEGYIVLEGGAGGGLALSSQINVKNLNGERNSYMLLAAVVNLCRTMA
jgi:alpha-mannosidase